MGIFGNGVLSDTLTDVNKFTNKTCSPSVFYVLDWDVQIDKRRMRSLGGQEESKGKTMRMFWEYNPDYEHNLRIKKILTRELSKIK